MANKYAVNPEGVKGLKDCANQMEEALERVSKAAAYLEDAYESNEVGLGPHSGRINQCLEYIKTMEEKAEVPITDLCEALRDLADDYQADIDDSGRYNMGN